MTCRSVEPMTNLAWFSAIQNWIMATSLLLKSTLKIVELLNSGEKALVGQVRSTFKFGH